MTLELTRPSDFTAMVDPDKGVVDRRIFSDQQIYELELERIFARAWNFVAHDSQIPNPGDFFLNYIGEDRVIVVRDKDMQVQVLINSCRHRGNAVCRAEEGHATSFMCTYHGWTYDLKGALVGVPGFKEVYHEDINREEWGLIRGRVETYHGFIFACLDEEAPGLDEFLGDVGRISIDLIAAQGDMVVVPGIQKYIIGCNWKLAVDNLFDYYHVGISHASSQMSGWQRRTPQQQQALQGASGLARPHLVMLGDYGHAIGGPMITEQTKNVIFNPAFKEEWRDTERARDMLGPVGIKSRGHPNVFPNMWVTESAQVSMRLPKGPDKTEIWWFTLVDRNLPEETIKDQVFRHNHVFGPAGMLEQDDGENWDQSTRGTFGKVTQRYPLNYAMGLGRGQIIEEEGQVPRIETTVNEHAQLWTYRGWADWMAAESWAELKANHTPAPRGYV